MKKNKKDEQFFEDLDKTTDLLRAFKHREVEETQDLNDLYNEINEYLEEEDLSNEESSDIEETVSEETVDNIEEKKTSKTDLEEIVNKISNDLNKDDEDANSTEEEPEEVSSDDVDDSDSIDITADDEEEEPKKKKKNKKKKNTDEKVKTSTWEKIFITCSIVFILGCCVFYGQRFIHYYRIYNPKTTDGKVLSLLSTEIQKNSTIVYEGDGLYVNGGDYIFKGSEVNNYIKYSNMLWRIVKTNPDGTIDLVLNDYINVLSWANKPNTYLNSDVNKYLNKYFIKYLNKDLLTKVSICTDEVNDIKGFKCDNKDENNYVKLPSINDFLNTKTDKTYMSSTDSLLWLSTTSSKEAWHINGYNISQAETNRALGIKPMVKLKVGVALLSGKGTADDPYIIEEETESVKPGDYVLLDSHVYIAYDVTEDYIDLSYDGFMKTTYRYDINNNVFDLNSKNSLAAYLNNQVINYLSYKDKLIEKEWNVGKISTTYEDITSSKVKAKIGLIDYANLKFDTKLDKYFIMNGAGSNSLLYSKELIPTKPGINHEVSIAIRIKNGKISSGKGTSNEPYVVE